MDGDLAEVSQRLNHQEPGIGPPQPSPDGTRHADMVSGLTIVLSEDLLPAAAEMASLPSQHGCIEVRLKPTRASAPDVEIAVTSCLEDQEDNDQNADEH